ncbi:MAG: hypothetical protein AAGK17_05035 [Pseudomonadota bacterium]
MIETFIGAIIGGVLGAGITWIGIRFEKTSAKQTLAQALLVEIEALAARDQSSLEGLIVPVVESWKADGDVKNADILGVVFGEDAALRFPVYHASVADLGLLPSSSSLPLMRFHNLRSGLLSAGKLMCSFDHDPDTVKQVALEIELALREMMEAKEQAVRGLKAISKELGNDTQASLKEERETGGDSLPGSKP